MGSLWLGRLSEYRLLSSALHDRTTVGCNSFTCNDFCRVLTLTLGDVKPRSDVDTTSTDSRIPARLPKSVGC